MRNKLLNGNLSKPSRKTHHPIEKLPFGELIDKKNRRPETVRRFLQ